MSDYAERYGLTQPEESWRRLAEAFARDEVAPAAREADRERRFPRDLVARMAALKILGAPLPQEFGGSGASTLVQTLIAEEIGRVDGSLRGFLAVHVGLVAQTIADFGTPAQRSEWLPRLATGGAIGCFAITEPQAGSDAGAVTATARRDGADVVLDGEKHWITNGGFADVALVFATVEPGAGPKGVECYVVPTSSRGFRAEPMAGRELGHRASDHARITLAGVRVPAASRLGPERGGFAVAMKGLEHGRLHVAAGAVGIQAACLDASAAHARARRQFGSRIGDFQQVGAALAEMRVALEASRLLVHLAARRVDRGLPAGPDASAAKLFATEAALQAATRAVRLHGAAGYSDALPLERHYRDAVGLTIYEGTSEIQRLILARDLLGKDEARDGARPPRPAPSRKEA
jgi:alkylation response protein AidB-like acyl-CoA dehydrogenase